MAVLSFLSFGLFFLHIAAKHAGSEKTDVIEITEISVHEFFNFEIFPY